MSRLPGVLEDTRWLLEAVCASVDPELWFPQKRRGPAPAEAPEDPAIAICRSCPVRVSHCLPYARALESGLPLEFRFGIFAGRTPRQRWLDDSRAMARDQAMAEAG